ncbi:hypothetical protein PHLGIDRAFT_87036 [Phlebiopsis gigantea 11061_1 CR5-6]|uniref:Glutamyl-tRNA(Gln) amidotransferase subunit F, mitochondrial n=1 Tax=Phlebiopsis gigantea (strain 11061_1 CR5-6) TaxID=745531 RepID=A0A0C3SCW8_PHLG1|nr:hypothetical protein PHLGIDRAFT_87036 [Phlebiopsis gigantea 11061_1 CR5-6]
MSRTLRLLPLRPKVSSVARWKSTTCRAAPAVKTDSCGIPLEPTWSVNKLISSYSKPTIAPLTLKKLHDLSALIPPEEGTPQHAQLTEELSNLVKLVEAVKAVDVGQPDERIPDGRIWAEGTGVQLERGAATKGGRDLLRHAARTEDGFYVVDADRSR